MEDRDVRIVTCMDLMSGNFRFFGFERVKFFKVNFIIIIKR